MSGDPNPKPPSRIKAPKVLQRSARINRESVKRIAERPVRKAVRQETIMRYGGQCIAKQIVPEVGCWGPIDVDEITARGTNPGSHLNPNLTQTLCRGHHDWKNRYPAEAERRGLRVRGGATTRDELP